MLADWLVGSWVLAPKGGQDGRTDCGQFNAPTLYRLNGNTARILTFRSNGEFRSIFAHTTPSNQEHYTNYQARRSVSGGKLSLANMSAHDAFDVDGGSSIQTVSLHGENTVLVQGDGLVGGGRYVRCVGATDDIYGE